MDLRMCQPPVQESLENEGNPFSPAVDPRREAGGAKSSCAQNREQPFLTELIWGLGRKKRFQVTREELKQAC